MEGSDGSISSLASDLAMDGYLIESLLEREICPLGNVRVSNSQFGRRRFG